MSVDGLHALYSQQPGTIHCLPPVLHQALWRAWRSPYFPEIFHYSSRLVGWSSVWICKNKSALILFYSYSLPLAVGLLSQTSCLKRQFGGIFYIPFLKPALPNPSILPYFPYILDHILLLHTQLRISFLYNLCMNPEILQKGAGRFESYIFVQLFFWPSSSGAYSFSFSMYFFAFLWSYICICPHSSDDISSDTTKTSPVAHYLFPPWYFCIRPSDSYYILSRQSGRGDLKNTFFTVLGLDFNGCSEVCLCSLWPVNPSTLCIVLWCH